MTQGFSVPPVGSIITVTVRQRDIYYHREQDYMDVTYENVPVVKPFPWVGEGDFCVPAEGEPYITTRTINIRNVVALEIHGDQGGVEEDTNTTYVEVAGTKGKTYTVTIVDGEAKDCECLGYQYRGECRHLRQALGITPVNPRRKPPRKKGTKRPRKGATSKADLVRGMILEHKGTRSQEEVIQEVVTKLGFGRALARTYVRNNWEKV